MFSHSRDQINNKINTEIPFSLTEHTHTHTKTEQNKTNPKSEINIVDDGSWNLALSYLDGREFETTFPKSWNVCYTFVLEISLVEIYTKKYRFPRFIAKYTHHRIIKLKRKSYNVKNKNC